MIVLAGCATPAATGPYERATSAERADWRHVGLPVSPPFEISRGAFGGATHSVPGREYSWDFDVPYGTPVVAAEAGVVLSWYTPDGGGGCDARYNALAWNLKVKHSDGTVAQYVHVRPEAAPGRRVRKGERIAVTAMNGFICQPQLDFGVYSDVGHLPGSDAGMRTIPLWFEGLPEGLASQGLRATGSETLIHR